MSPELGQIVGGLIGIAFGVLFWLAVMAVMAFVERS